MSAELTARQQKLYDWLAEYIKSHGYAPTYREMKVALGYTSETPARQAIAKLKDKGCVTWQPGKARTLRLLQPFPETDDDRPFGEQIRKARGRCHLTQQQLAERVHISRPHLCHIEKGTTGHTPTEETLSAIARELGLDADMLLLSAGRIPEKYKDVVLANVDEFKQWAQGRIVA